MDIAIYAFFTIACSISLSAVAFLVGRCGRRLPIDGMLPRVVHSARFGPQDEPEHAAAGTQGPGWPHVS
jgi:hypothetical protein